MTCYSSGLESDYRLLAVVVFVFLRVVDVVAPAVLLLAEPGPPVLLLQLVAVRHGGDLLRLEVGDVHRRREHARLPWR